MKDLFEICGECRHLSDAEVVYQLTNNKETSNQVNAMLANGGNVSIEDICNLLTPARREMALAVIELYKRIKERKNNSKTIRASTDVYEVMHPYMADLKVEECWAIYLNQAARIIRKQRISVGGLASTQVDVRVILREALTCNATSMILCHNHPSGNTRPSQDDDRLTHSLLEAGRTMNIRLLDHVIVADGSHYSYGDEGRL
jgi:DNA repair protein RadC